jgi:hypothetical protein
VDKRASSQIKAVVKCCSCRIILSKGVSGSDPLQTDSSLYREMLTLNLARDLVKNILLNFDYSQSVGPSNWLATTSFLSAGEYAQNSIRYEYH